MKFPTLATLSLAACAVNAAPHHTQHLSKHAAKRQAAQADTALSGKTVLAYYGQTDASKVNAPKLSEVCDNASFDMVVLSFITSLNPPKLNMGKDTGAASAAQQAKAGFELFDGTVAPEGSESIANQIAGCQSKGKKVLISFGGDSRFSNATFSSADEAKAAADSLWNLFLGGKDTEDIRPFGASVVLDGLDLDNESGNGKFYQEFVTEVRAKMGSDTSGKKYLIGAAPMCAVVKETESSIPDSVLPMLDFLNVQFYNNQAEGISGNDFEANIKAWAAKFAAAQPSPKLLLGVPGGEFAAGDSIQTADEIKKTIERVKGMNIAGFGGVGIWDAGYALANNGFSEAVKGSL